MVSCIGFLVLRPSSEVLFVFDHNTFSHFLMFLAMLNQNLVWPPFFAILPYSKDFLGSFSDQFTSHSSIHNIIPEYFTIQSWLYAFSCSFKHWNASRKAVFMLNKSKLLQLGYKQKNIEYFQRGDSFLYIRSCVYWKCINAVLYWTIEKKDEENEVICYYRLRNWNKCSVLMHNTMPIHSGANELHCGEMCWMRCLGHI